MKLYSANNLLKTVNAKHCRVAGYIIDHNIIYGNIIQTVA